MYAVYLPVAVWSAVYVYDESRMFYSCCISPLSLSRASVYIIPVYYSCVCSVNYHVSYSDATYGIDDTAAALFT